MCSDTPAYYPEGWDRERLLNAAVTSLDGLTEDQWATFREGLRAEEGDQGFEEFFDEMWKREKIAKGEMACLIAGISHQIPSLSYIDPELMTISFQVSRKSSLNLLSWSSCVFESSASDRVPSGIHGAL
jgi:hypothetical protein